MNSSRLTELEEDIQQQLSRAEERVRQEVSAAPAAPVTCKDYIFSLPWMSERHEGANCEPQRGKAEQKMHLPLAPRCFSSATCVFAMQRTEAGLHASSQRASVKCDKSPSSRLQPACTSDCFGFHVGRSRRRWKKFWQVCSGSMRTKCQTCKRLWTDW